MTKNRDTETLQKFICKYVSPGNNIVTNGWKGYNFLSNIGYICYRHNHANEILVGVKNQPHILRVSGINKNLVSNLHIKLYKIKIFYIF